MQDRASIIEALLLQAQGKPPALLQLARLMREDRQEERAVETALVVAADPSASPGLVRQAQAFLADGVPGWHVPMLIDGPRNRAYAEAIARHVRPGMRVFEIGTGSGLLAMLAARAGAEVVTCESNPLIARVAGEVIAANCLADRIRIVARRSDTLCAEDIGGPADLLLSEIFGPDLLGEDVLPSHTHALACLLKPGARSIPSRGTICVALARLPERPGGALTDVEGFDLSAFARAVGGTRQIRVDSPDLQLCGPPADLFAFDLADPKPRAAETHLNLRSDGGRVDGVVQWIAIDLDAQTRYENRPGSGVASHWAAGFHRFAQPLETVPGAAVAIGGAHDRRRVVLWQDPA